VTERLFIVGDIHACPGELETLLTALSLHSGEQVVFVGDYIDRGPGAAEVIDLLLDLRATELCHLTFLKGNHEDMFLDFMGLPGRYGEAFLANGGDTTLKSYGFPRMVRDSAVKEALPPSHLQFLLDLRLSCTLGGVLCVHAGLNPMNALQEQDEEDLLWIRREFIFHPHPFPYTVIFGHTPQREVFFDLPYKVGIDTGLVYGGKLSCLEMTEKTLWQVAKGSRKAQISDVSAHWRSLR
jgi:serine/threonine protein phosphatase 1